MTSRQLLKWNPRFGEFPISSNILFWNFSWTHYFLKVWFVEFMVSPVYQIPLSVQVMFLSSLCWEFKLSFKIINVHLIHKTKGSCGQVIFSLWYPISIDELFINLFLTPLPNEPDTSSFYLYYLDPSCSVVPI